MSENLGDSRTFCRGEAVQTPPKGLKRPFYRVKSTSGGFLAEEKMSGDSALRSRQGTDFVLSDMLYER